MIRQGLSDETASRLRWLCRSNSLPESRLNVHIKQYLDDIDAKNDKEFYVNMAKMLTAFINPKMHEAAFPSEDDSVNQRQSVNGEVDMSKISEFLSAHNLGGKA
jgi:hypothetical protein